MNKNLAFIFIAIIAFGSGVSAQGDRWQQHINYNIKASLDVNTNIVKGTEDIVYTNNSTDTLRKVYFHLYWNAFQPNSSMDVRSRELGKNTMTSRRGDMIKDWDARVTDRIQKLTPAEIGYQRVSQILIGGKAQKLIEHETILEVQLTNPIAPKTSAKLSLVFEAQVPKQIRRSGRDNAEGVRYSMSQWYPKMVEYDYQGWKIAYILVDGDPGYDSTTPHGLIAATSDQTTSAAILWNNGSFTSTGATGTNIGMGLSNTNTIITSQGPTSTDYAAGLARAYTGGGFTDWYLPSINELGKLYLNRVLIGGFASGNTNYWSSTEESGFFSYYFDFSNGNPSYNTKNDFYRVRAVRSF